MLDHLSEGRFEFGTGRGSSSTEFKGFGIPDGDTTRAMYDEALREILRMWRETRYSYEGTLLLDARAQRAAEAVQPSRTRRSGSRAAARRRSRRRRASASARCASASARRATSSR